MISIHSVVFHFFLERESALPHFSEHGRGPYSISEEYPVSLNEALIGYSIESVALFYQQL